ncbi:hypothetical protein EDEG_02501 [Edhazardia aedis USNM 41457]|uniref:Uncharacterized protein n=1 Tax=Edhazardia aedis (strain USNM 41457) TaxID=1003232 RepID=J9DKK2_EDHAE|nr:hypothetical protein EDEG_02501 [Edhazardia aedis USNM 41457]|eukprot:EJW03115.1 hypothetical protein EDEG_02501 [Edhazardia aedis USNM 41457]
MDELDFEQESSMNDSNEAISDNEKLQYTEAIDNNSLYAVENIEKAQESNMDNTLLLNRLSKISNRIDILNGFMSKFNHGDPPVRKNLKLYKLLNQNKYNYDAKVPKDAVLNEINNEIRSFTETEMLNLVNLSIYPEVDKTFWGRIAKKFAIQPYDCIKVWVNRFDNNDTPFSESEDMRLLHLASNKNSDWLLISQMMKRQPFALFKRYKLISTKKAQKDSWTGEEHRKLVEAVNNFGEGKWSKVSKYVETKSAKQCMHKYRAAFQCWLNKGRWTQEEDERLVLAVNEYGAKNWNKISECVRTRNDSQCRERFVNVLDPKVKRDSWSFHEDLKLLEYVRIHGDKNWSAICKHIPGRTDNQCRRRYLFIVKKNNYHTFTSNLN